MNEMSNSDTDVDFDRIFRAIWINRAQVTGIAIAVTLCSVLLAITWPSTYTSSTLLAPSEQSGGSMTGLMAQYGGLASIAGVTLPGGGEASQAQMGIELMQSRAFLIELVKKHDLAPILAAVDYWDSEKGLVYNDNVYDVDSNKWIKNGDGGVQSKPTELQLYRMLRDRLDVSENVQTGFITLSIEHQSPQVAANLANLIVSEVNLAMKNQDVSEATRSIEYLKTQVAATSLTELQAVFFELIQSQTETMMLAEVRPEYVFKQIDPAVTPDLPSKPNKPFFVLIGLIVGLMLGITLALISDFKKLPE